MASLPCVASEDEHISCAASGFGVVPPVESDMMALLRIMAETQRAVCRAAHQTENLGNRARILALVRLPEFDFNTRTSVRK